MRILITGGSGFIGSALGPRLAAAGHELLCVCRTGASASFGETVIWDAESPLGTKLPAAADAVIHLAQSRSYRDFPADSREMFDVNIGMTMGIAPVTGIPLPFVTVGGSSMVANLVAIGVLEAIHARGRPDAFQ